MKRSGAKMEIIQFNGEAVVETRVLARMYGQTPIDIANAYFENEDRFKEGEHFYLLDDRFVDFAEFKGQFLEHECLNHEKIYLWTDQGLYEHATLIKGQGAWHSYCQFIYFVFNKSEEVKKAIQVLQKAQAIITNEQFIYFLAKEVL